MIPNKNILIMKTGTTNPPVVSEFGDYDDWFQASLATQNITWHIVSVFDKEPIPNVEMYDGILITGSPSSVYEDKDWIKHMIVWLKERIKKQDIPIFAICFGHQLLGAALGGTVCANPKGRENGTISVQLNKEGVIDPLFHKLPTPLAVQSVHMDIVTDLPAQHKFLNLASTNNTQLQAFKIGAMIRSVQFHPEITASTLSKLFFVRNQKADVFPTTHGASILRNWFTHWILE